MCIAMLLERQRVNDNASSARTRTEGVERGAGARLGNSQPQEDEDRRQHGLDRLHAS